MRTNSERLEWSAPTSSEEVAPKTIADAGRATRAAGNGGKRQGWLLAGLDQDCPRHPRINQRRGLQPRPPGERRGRKGRTRTWRDTAVARIRVRDAEKLETAARRKSYSGLVRESVHYHHHSRTEGFAPSMNKQPVLLLFRALSVSSSLSPFLPLCLSVHSSASVPHSLPVTTFFSLTAKKR